MSGQGLGGLAKGISKEAASRHNGRVNKQRLHDNRRERRAGEERIGVESGPESGAESGAESGSSSG